MNVLVVSSSPNTDGLTAACAQAALDAIRAAGQQAEELRLNDYHINICRACGHGWGSCWQEHRCEQEDAFQELHKRFLAADGYVLVTPVYWGDPSESMKAFTDRLRRCESNREGRSGGIAGKPVLAVAAAGGSGNGTVHCLDTLERWIQHVGGRKTDFIGVTRLTRSYKLGQIAAAAQALASGATHEH
jgi:multimeric flavodoxin WrbA